MKRHHPAARALALSCVIAASSAFGFAAPQQETEVTVNIVEHITATGGNTVTQPARLADMVKRQGSPLPTPEKPDDARDKEKAPDQEGSETPKERQGISSGTTKMAGYRVQVFSDGNQRTAKNEARRKAGAVSSRFPQYRTYSSYSAPYWRLRVGDFKTRREAEDAAKQLRTAFPAQKNEIRVVRDRINARD